MIGGCFSSYNGRSRNRIARLNSDGSLDTGFDPGTGADNWVQSVAVQSDGKILIGGGFTSYNGTSRNRIARTRLARRSIPTFRFQFAPYSPSECPPAARNTQGGPYRYASSLRSLHAVEGLTHETLLLLGKSVFCRAQRIPRASRLHANAKCVRCRRIPDRGALRFI